MNEKFVYFFSLWDHYCLLSSLQLKVFCDCQIHQTVNITSVCILHSHAFGLAIPLGSLVLFGFFFPVVDHGAQSGDSLRFMVIHFKFFSIFASLSKFGVPKCEEEICSQFLHVNTKMTIGAHRGAMDMGGST